ncbi:MAG: hypothetical protein K6G22_08320 [Lachnospiraceae bacterium]|nr:hypothetical protein [Lachnospiraceae bacterium]
MFISNINGDLPGYVSGDKLRVRQIITNIVSNAVKYTKEGSVSFNVSGRVSEAWSSYAIVAHAVKSSSKSIGAMNFSALSLEMEKAAKAENADYIRDNFSYYYESYEKVLKRLEEIMH